MWQIKKNTIDAIIAAAQHTYPNEFAAFLGGDLKTKQVFELVLVPTVFGDEHAILRTDLIPLKAGIVGSVHSHPDYFNQPSLEDKRLFFAHGEIHLIISAPYQQTSIAAYSNTAKRIPFGVMK